MLVSVIIPALNEAGTICECVEAVRRRYTRDEVEIIVVDGGSTDGTLSRVPAGVTAVRSERGRAVQMNRGAEQARGSIVLFCHADSRLPPEWRAPVIEALQQPAVSGGAFQIAYHPPRGILHLVNRLNFWSDWRAIHGDRAQFTTRETFEAIGGFPEIPLMEDVELSRALHQRGKLVLLPQRVLSSSRRFLEKGPLRQFLSSIINVTRYLYLGATPEDIAQVYRSSREERRRVRRGHSDGC